jgi:hypothetical protein
MVLGSLPYACHDLNLKSHHDDYMTTGRGNQILKTDAVLTPSTDLGVGHGKQGPAILV